MKVLLVIPNLPEKMADIKGGIYSATSNLARALSSEKIQTSVVSFNSGIKEPYSNKVNDYLTIYYEPEGALPFHALNFLFSVPFRMKKYIRLLKPDILHYELGGAFLFARLFHTGDVKTVLTIHGIPLAEIKTIKKAKKRLNYLFHGWTERLLAPPYLVHLSDFSRSFFNQHWHKKYKGELIPNAVPESYFSVPALSVMNNRIVCIGVIDENKNQLLLFEAIHALRMKGKAFNVTVVGGYRDPNYEAVVTALVNKLALSDLVEFRGWCTQEEIVTILSDSSILTVTSLHESLPMVIAEAMAASRCVVASAVGGIPEMIEDGVTGLLFESENLSALVHKLEMLHDNHELVQSLATNGHQQAKFKYSSTAVAKRTIEFYKHILSG